MPGDRARIVEARADQLTAFFTSAPILASSAVRMPAGECEFTLPRCIRSYGNIFGQVKNSSGDDRLAGGLRADAGRQRADAGRQRADAGRQPGRGPS